MGALIYIVVSVGGAAIFFKGLKRGISDGKRVMLIGTGLAVMSASINLFVNHWPWFPAVLGGIGFGSFIAIAVGGVLLLRRAVKWWLTQRQKSEKYKRKVAKSILEANAAVLGKTRGNNQQP